MKGYKFSGISLALILFLVICLFKGSVMHVYAEETETVYDDASENVEDTTLTQTDTELFDEPVLIDESAPAEAAEVNEPLRAAGNDLAESGVLSVSVKNNAVTVVVNVLDDHMDSVLVPVWTDANGQSDIIWHEVRKQGANVWIAEFSVRAYNYVDGIYNIHAYGRYADGNMKFLSGTKQDIQPTLNGNLNVLSKDDDFGRVSLRIDHICAPFDIKTVYVPIWSEVDGQDDICWYVAEQKNGQWEVEFSALNHKAAAGKYQMHLYYEDAQGKLTFVQAQTVEVSMKFQEKTGLEFKYGDEGTLSVTLNNYLAAAGEKIYLPVWTQNNGQDDIHWYEARKINDFTWGVQVDLQAHNYESGEYIAHAYVQSANGNMAFIAYGSTRLQSVFGGDLRVTSKDSKTGTFTIEISNVKAPYNAYAVKVPLWSSINGQDDIIWYEAYKKGDCWYVDVDTASHNYDNGTYNIHLYYIEDNGNAHFIQAITTELELVEGGAPLLTVSKNQEQSEILVTVRNIPADSNVESVLFPVWSSVNGQDDLTWYSGKRTNASTWKTSVNIANHSGDPGTYNIHAYRRLKDGSMEMLDGTSINIDTITVDSKMEITDLDAQSGQFRVKIRGIHSPSAITGVFFPVWSEKDGQDDIRWYEAQQEGDSWYADIRAANHGYDQGLYNIHCYAYDVRGTRQYLDAATKDINVDNITDGSMSSSVIASSWVVYDTNAGEILYARNPDNVVQLASQTKLMTALVVLDHVNDLDAVVTMTPSAASGMSWDTTMAGLVVGRGYTVRNLLEGLLVYSGGDCAGLLAEYVAGTRTEFVNMMNKKASELGMYNTGFSDPVGLYSNYTTPREYMKLASCADNNPIIRSITQMPSCVVRDTGGISARRLSNSNGLVSGSVAYDHGAYTVDGLKTGFTDEAGYCLTASAFDSHKRIIAAVFNSNGYTQRAVDCRSLLNFVFR